ncbi:MAG: hypothetical protein KJ941_00130 [Bacteroidetes bacterium]|nr:hypothetical protein [Bacteroidota bacterium]
MKQLISFFSLSVMILFLSACKEEIDVNTSYKETPVIFGLLDQTDSVHYIKINRGFVGPGNALDFAKIPDSNYFEKVEAKIEEIIGGKIERTWNLRDTLLKDKSTNGVFFGPEYKAYYFTTITEPALKNEAVYRLTVNINDSKLIVKGETQLVSGFAENNTLENQTSSLRFAKLPGEFVSQSVSFNKGTSAFANVRLDILISEFRGNQKDTVTIPWNIFEGESSGATYSASAQGQSFYQTIRNGITNDNTITKRNLEGIRFTFTGGSTDLFNYVAVTKPSSSLSQNKPIFTNLTVNGDYRVLGVFSSRKTISFYKSFINLNQNNQQTSFRAIDKNSTRELCQGASLVNFLFCSQHVNDSNDDFKCN